MFAVLVLLPCVSAQSFDASEFFGDAWTPGDEPDSGTLAVPLREGRLPGFIDLGSSGVLPASTRGLPTAAGIVATPERRGTVEFAIDLGAKNAEAELQLAELDLGGTLAWRLRGLSDEPAEFLAEVMRRESGFQLSLRVRNGARFIQVPGARVNGIEADLPASLAVRFDEDSVVLTFAGHEVKADARLAGGAMLSVAASDQRARIHTLAVKATLAEAWTHDAAARLQARKALVRLREFATAGLLSGVAAASHPNADALLAGYDEARRARRAESAQAVPPEQAAMLAALADELPENALANHEAGVAALLAGKPAAARSLLRRAEKLDKQPLTMLALTEALRRTGDLDGARRAFAHAARKLPEALEPDAALIEARLLAGRGDLAGARDVLAAALRKRPEHPQLRAFADSAHMLTQPPTLRASGLKGPFGLQLASDMPDEVLRPLSLRLQPYLQAIADWLPGLPEALEGRIVIYTGPVEYLSTALLVAGDHLDNVAGMFIAEGMEGKPTVLACRAFGEDELTRTLVHELWHLCLRAAGGADLPRWLDEGMAVFLSAGRLEGVRLVFDRVPAEFAEAEGLLPRATEAGQLARALEGAPWEFYQAANARLNYATAWAVVWYHARDSSRRGVLLDALKETAAPKLDAEDLAPKLEAALARLK